MEFEALHPFLDGNGRLGRMLVPLFLYKMKLLDSPTFYISEYFEKNRDEYYERLLVVSHDGDWTQWCVYFLGAVCAQAKANQEKASAILGLYEDKKKLIADLTHSQYAIHALDFMFYRPVFKASDFGRQPNIPPATAQRILKLLREDGLLTVIWESSGRKSAVLAFKELLRIAEGQDVV